MKYVFNSLAVLSLVAVSSAHAADYKELSEYRALAEALVLETQATSGTLDEVAQLKEKTRDLMKSGVDTLNLYASKQPVCAEQFKVFISELPSIETMSLKDLHDRYHDGIGLPKAPGHCYLGRSQVVHPALNVVRLNQPFNESLRENLLHDLEEVIEHLALIQKKLDAP